MGHLHTIASDGQLFNYLIPFLKLFVTSQIVLFVLCSFKQRLDYYLSNTPDLPCSPGYNNNLDGGLRAVLSIMEYYVLSTIINGLASVETEDILTPADSRTRKNHSFKFKYLQANCDSYRYSFFLATISSWNNLPFSIEKVDSVEGFKLKLNEHTFRSP